MELRKRWKLRRSASGISVDISFASGVRVGMSLDRASQISALIWLLSLKPTKIHLLEMLFHCLKFFL